MTTVFDDINTDTLKSNCINKLSLEGINCSVSPMFGSKQILLKFHYNTVLSNIRHLNQCFPNTLFPSIHSNSSE